MVQQMIQNQKNLVNGTISPLIQDDQSPFSSNFDINDKFRGNAFAANAPKRGDLLKGNNQQRQIQKQKPQENKGYAPYPS